MLPSDEPALEPALVLEVDIVNGSCVIAASLCDAMCCCSIDYISPIARG